MRQVQRARLIAAMIAVAARHGAGQATVSRVASHAGVSRRTFYEWFADREQCLLAAFDEGVARVIAATSHCAGTGPWRTRMRARLTAGLRLFEEEPDTAKLLVVTALGGGERLLARRAQVLGSLAELVRQGAAEGGADGGISSLSAEGVVGAVLAILYRRMCESARPRLLELTPQLMGIVVLPYCGQAAAKDELSRDLAAHGAEAERAPRTRLAPPDVRLRFTYRTVRVLTAIAAQPGVSNREVAAAAGVHDQGQMSKLLNRLAGLGLIANGRPTEAKGAQNAWTLTRRGHQIVGAAGDPLRG